MTLEDRIRRFVLVAAVFALAVSTVAATASGRVALKDLDYELRTGLQSAIKARAAEIAKEENAQGIKNRRASYSRLLTKVDDSTYRASMLVRTAEETDLRTERVQLTLTRQPGKKASWAVTGEEQKQSFVGFHRTLGGKCYPMDGFSFDREGMRMSAGRGGVCEYYYEGEVQGFVVAGEGMTYDYTAPKYLDYYAVQEFLVEDYSKDIEFTPARFYFRCDGPTCEELLGSCFTGLNRQPEPDRAAAEIVVAGTGIPGELADWVAKQNQEQLKDRREKPFSGFRRPDLPDNRYYTAQAQKTDKESVGITYNNWEGFDVRFWVEINWPDVGHQTADIFGYYTEETMASTTPYDLERRDDLDSRWYELFKVKGELEIALEDPEIIAGDVEYGLNIKRDLQVLPFVVAIRPRDTDAKKPSLFINSVDYQGEDVTWVQTSPFGGYIVFPEPLPAGEEVELRIIFTSKALTKVNHAFTRTPRATWLPLVRIFDFIDEFDLTLKTPAKYQILGPGRRVSDKKEGNIRVSRWVAENPVEFPSFIFGKYETAEAQAIEAKKLDGTKIPVTTHVDEVSLQQLDIEIETGQDAKDTTEALRAGAMGIRSKQLRPISEQAAAAINIFTRISGVDYPYGELNLVNDPVLALYGQAPSALIYLGSLVFRGEGTMSSDSDSFIGGGGTSTAKFLKSVVAHEVGHQWWGSRVANANTRNYWFVESLAEYFSALYLEEIFGPQEYQEQVDEWRRTILDRDLKGNVQHASVLFPGGDPGSYQAAVYNKGPYAFHMLRQTFGDEKFFEFIKKFTLELTEKREIVTRDIQAAAERALGGLDENGNEYTVDLEWFFDQWIRGVGIPQYSFRYDVRQAEDGRYIVEGTIDQRVVTGHKRKYYVMNDKYYRGIVPITVLLSSGKEYKLPVIVEGAQTPFQLPPLPEKPVEISLNKYGDILAHDILDNQSF